PNFSGMGWLLRGRTPAENTASAAPTRERRSGYRQSYQVPCLLIPPAGGAIEVTVRDLSPHGLSYDSAQRFVTGTEVSIKFTTPETRNLVHSVMVRGGVQWSQQSKRREQPYRYGLRFLPLSVQEHLDLIRFFLDQYGFRFADPGEKRGSVRLQIQPVP